MNLSNTQTNANNGIAPYLLRQSINGDISDLWFNHDNSAAWIEGDKGECGEWDETLLRVEATWFLASLKRLGVSVPTVDDLIADFYNRI